MQFTLETTWLFDSDNREIDIIKWHEGLSINPGASRYADYKLKLVVPKILEILRLRIISSIGQLIIF